MSTSRPMPFQPDSMSVAQSAAVSYLARYSGHTRDLYACHCGGDTAALAAS